MFERAVREKYRFQTAYGPISVEDLWDLGLEDLDRVFKTLNARAKQSDEESLLHTRSREDEIVKHQIEIVKYIVETKLAEKDAREHAAERSAKRQKLLAILEEKQEAGLHELSEEELQQLINDLDS